MATVTQRQVKLQPVAQVTFAWPGYNPEAALSDFEPAEFENVQYDARAGDLAHVPGTTLGDVYQWMEDNGLTLFCPPTRHGTAKDRSGFGRKWLGRNTLTLAREVGP
jgi:hypothetical protein